MAQILVEGLLQQQQQQQPQLPDSAAQTPWRSPQAPLPPQRSVEAQLQPHRQQPQLSGAAAPDPWPPPMSADLDESNSEREIGRHDSLVFVLGEHERQEKD